MINKSILSIERNLATEVGSISITEFLLQTVYNGSDVTINKGEVVYVAGAQGNAIVVGEAIASLPHDSEVIGVALENIINGGYGSIVIHGIIDGLNTDSFSEGDRLYLSAASYGQITNVKPSAPNHAVLIGYCVKKDILDGAIYVNVNTGEHLKELHDVNVDSAIGGQYLFLDNDQIWKNKTIEYTDVSGLSGVLSGFYPASNPSGFITGVNLANYITTSQTGAFYAASNPSGFITGIENLVYTTGDQSISGDKIFENLLRVGALEVGLGTQTPTLYMEEGRVGINNENPTSALDVSGLTKFSERPFVNGSGVVLSGEIDTSMFYPRDNPSGFITGIENLVYTTGDQTISGIKAFANNVTILGNFAVSGTTFINEVIDVTTTGVISGVTGVFQYLEADNIVYSETTSSVVVQPGDDILAKYAEAKLLTPNGAAISPQNRASLIILAGTYSLPATWEIDTDGVDVIGLGATSFHPSVFIEINSGDQISVSCNYIRIVGIGVEECLLITSTNGDNCIGVVFEKCFASGGNSFNANSGQNISADFIDCQAGSDSFGVKNGLKGNLVNCKGGDTCFSFGGNASGTFTNCQGGDYSFGGGNANYYGTAQGTFVNCTAGINSFGGGDDGVSLAGLSTGVFTNCTAGAGSFGQIQGGTNKRGKYFNCVGINVGNLSAPTSGFAIQLNCTDLNGNIIEGFKP